MWTYALLFAPSHSPAPQSYKRMPRYVNLHAAEESRADVRDKSNLKVNAQGGSPWPL